METRAKNLILTSPRPVRVTDPQVELVNLYKLLVEKHIQRVSEPESRSRLDELMNQPGLAEKVAKNVRIYVPVIHFPLMIPYAYQNGAYNLVYPKDFSPRRGTATKQACQLAAEGRLIGNHEDPQLGRMKLLVIPELQEHGNGLVSTIEQVFREHDVRVVWPTQLDDLAVEIRSTAQTLWMG